jgi:hypothetical protein
MEAMGLSWQNVAALVTIAGVGVGFYTSVHVRLRALEIEVKGLQDAQEKTDTKFDQIMAMLTDIKISLSNKQDRPR